VKKTIIMFSVIIAILTLTSNASAASRALIVVGPNPVDWDQSCYLAPPMPSYLYNRIYYELSEMGYVVTFMVKPSAKTIRDALNNSEYKVFVVFAHGNASAFICGCGGTTTPLRYDSFTYKDAKISVAQGGKVPFSFLDFCDSLKSSSSTTINYQLRKGSSTNTSCWGLTPYGTSLGFGEFITSFWDYLSQKDSVGTAFGKITQDGGFKLVGSKTIKLLYGYDQYGRPIHPERKP